MSTHSFVRVDCKAFAKCGIKSLSHCRRYRGEDNYCKGCTLIRRKPRNRKFDAGGREMKKCTHCGHYFYLNRFYANMITSHGKKYQRLSSWCRMCMSKVNGERKSKNKQQ